MKKVTGVLLLALTLTTAVTGQTTTTDEADGAVCSSSTQMLYAAVGQVKYLTSPDYPHKYPNNLQCGWLIAAGAWDSTNVVKVTILTASMEQCCDYVQLYDGSYYESRSLVKFYSMPNQTVYYSSGQYMYIKFTTDGSVTSLGFRLTYEAVDRQNVSTPSPPLTITTDVASVCSYSGVYTDVRYGQPKLLSFTRYTNSLLDCRWIIRSADINDYFQPYIIHVTVEDFTLSPCTLTGCSCGYLQVFDGDSTSATSLGRVCASSYTTTDFYSSGRYATVRFYGNDYTYSSASFRLRYESVPQADVSTTRPPLTTTTDVATVCSSSGVYTDVRYGQPQVLNFARNIYSSLDCQWIIRSADTNDYFTPYVIHVTVEEFIFSSCSWSGCSCGYLQVFDGDSTSATSLGRVCASSYTTTDFYSSGRYATVLFYANSYTYSSASFRLHYESVPQADVSTTRSQVTTTTAVTSVCSSSPLALSAVVAQVKYLSSPNYPQNYYNNANCHWRIALDNLYTSDVIKVTVVLARMEQCGDSCCDYVQLFDGISDSSPSLGSFCSNFGQTVYYSSGKYMYIKFYSDHTNTDDGFLLTYEVVQKPVCPVNAAPLSAVVGQAGYLSSPNYPMNYDSNTNCEWLVDTGSLVQVVKVTVYDVSMQQCFTCCDYLQLFDGRSASSASLVQLCSMPSQTVYYSSGQYLFIRFYSDSALTYSGFTLTYEAVYYKQPLPSSDETRGHLTAAVVGGILGTAFLILVIVLIYVLRCRRQRLRPRNTYLYSEATSSSNNNLLYTTPTAPPAYNSVYVVGAPPPYPGIATPYPITGVTNGAFVPTEVRAEEGAAANPSVAQEQEAKVQPPAEGDSPPPYSPLEESTYANVTPPCSTPEESTYANVTPPCSTPEESIYSVA